MEAAGVPRTADICVSNCTASHSRRRCLQSPPPVRTSQLQFLYPSKHKKFVIPKSRVFIARSHIVHLYLFPFTSDYNLPNAHSHGMFGWSRQIEGLLVRWWVVHHHAICGLISHHLGLLVRRHVALGGMLAGGLLLLLVVGVDRRNVEFLVAKTGGVESLQHTAKRIHAKGVSNTFDRKLICRYK